jgi:IS30 family transposase
MLLPGHFGPVWCSIVAPGTVERVSESIRAIASAKGVAPSTVLRRRQRRDEYQPDDDGMITVGMTLGLDGKIRPDRRINTTERDKRIRKLHREGQSIRAIAADVGCSVGTVHRVISKGK